ncbi:MAG: class I SAM-dependent methyltransferase family protein [Methanobacterium sp.]|nr:class I SAM-dependent methyltransferase family protein [Methanobacterium sp.]
MRGKVIGDILVLKKEVKDPETLLEIPGVNRVVKLGRIRGKTRQPEVTVLVGEGTETIHKENHCLFKLDVSKIMWSKGNTTERKRIAELVEEREIVVDLFAGIGYFSIPMAVHSQAEKIYSLEINPTAFNYLCQNITLNQVDNVIEPIMGDCRDSAPYGVADRVLMGYIGNTHHYLDVALNTLKEEGGVIHYHESVPDKFKFTRPVDRIKEAAGDREVKIMNKKIIKKYSPGVYHVVVDAWIK